MAMNKRTRQLTLRQVLAACDNTAEFLQEVVSAIEALYAEAEGECPKGFAALDSAVQAFQETEEG